MKELLNQYTILLVDIQDVKFGVWNIYQITKIFRRKIGFIF